MNKLDVSVIMYARNRADSLPTALGHLEHQTFPAGRFEVLVVDDGSSDATAQVIDNFAAGAPVPTRCLRLGGEGPAHGRNRAIEEARGRWILFLDNGLLASPQLIERHVRAQEAYASRACIVGSIAPHPQMGRREFTRWVLPEDLGEFHEDRPLHFLDWRGANMSLSRALLLDVGGINESFPFPLFDDAELAWRLEQRGVEGRYVAAASAYVWLAAEFTEERRRYYAKGYSLHTLSELTKSARIHERFRLNQPPWRRRFDRFVMPYYTRACAKSGAGSPVFGRCVRRVLLYDLYRGFNDASRGRPPREAPRSL